MNLVAPHQILYQAVLTCILFWSCCRCQTYDNTKAIFDERFDRSFYHTEVPPVINQSQAVTIDVSFQLVTIVGVDDVGQKFLCNGFLTLIWTDERLAWDPADYNGQGTIRPLVKNIWKPRMMLLNTLEERDLFEDDHAPMTVNASGRVVWRPGSLFPSSCDLDMGKFPFDEQTCLIQLMPMGGNFGDYTFVVRRSDPVGQAFYTPNGQWRLLEAKVSIQYESIDELIVPLVVISFRIKRRPTILLFSVILPIVFLSFLNLLVFMIPQESGEKIGYGITVLLALSVFMSIVADLLPKSSTTLPTVTIYLFSLLVMSMLVVIVNIIIVLLHSLEENVDKSNRAKANLKQATRKVAILNRAVSPMETEGQPHQNYYMSEDDVMDIGRRSPVPDYTQDPLAGAFTTPMPNGREKSVINEKPKPKYNRYKIIGKHINLVSLIVFFLIWLLLTGGFLVSMAT